MNAPRQDEIILVAWSVWFPARRAWMEQVRRFRTMRDAVRQVARIPEWPYPAHLDGVFRAPVGAWEEITDEVQRLAAEPTGLAESGFGLRKDSYARTDEEG